MIKALKREKTGRPSPRAQFKNDLVTANIQAVLNFDGGCWPNPGPAVAGFVLKYGVTIVEGSVPIGHGTNNIAEYSGLILGLQAALDAGVTDIEVYGDSTLVVNGVKRGPWKKGNPKLEALKADAVGLLSRFRRAEVIWVPREENVEADALT
jgi:ribonuclease HI